MYSIQENRPSARNTTIWFDACGRTRQRMNALSVTAKSILADTTDSLSYEKDTQMHCRGVDASAYNLPGEFINRHGMQGSRTGARLIYWTSKAWTRVMNGKGDALHGIERRDEPGSFPENDMPYQSVDGCWPDAEILSRGMQKKERSACEPKKHAFISVRCG